MESLKSGCEGTRFFFRSFFSFAACYLFSIYVAPLSHRSDFDVVHASLVCEIFTIKYCYYRYYCYYCCFHRNHQPTCCSSSCKMASNSSNMYRHHHLSWLQLATMGLPHFPLFALLCTRERRRSTIQGQQPACWNEDY